MNRSPQRFTIDGCAELEAHLARTCDRVLEGVRAIVPPDALEGILLGGGYGRGEGGVLRTAAGEKPYNDLEYYVFVRGNAVLGERKYRHALHELGEHLSPDAGLEVEFKVLTVDKLRTSKPAMFYYDLVVGHRWVLGDDSLLAGCDHHRDPSRIPLHEATRLLMNRCSGLLFARARLQKREFDAADADFVGRNLAKAQLAFGDVLLTAQGLYHWSCQERHARLKNLTLPPDLAWAAPIAAQHAIGVEFKFHPVRSTQGRDDLGTRHAQLVKVGASLWLWLESKRLGTPFADLNAYIETAGNLCPETSGFRNRLVNARAFGAAAALGRDAARYPRERLFRSLCMLLFQGDRFRDPTALATLQRRLRTSATDLQGLVKAYGELWGRFN